MQFPTEYKISYIYYIFKTIISKEVRNKQGISIYAIISIVKLGHIEEHNVGLEI